MKVIEIQDLTTYQQTEKRGDPNPKSCKKKLVEHFEETVTDIFCNLQQYQV
jgi:hypothetical protein